ncbi:MAG: helix-hairpin-helix domain-containing protein, partial [Gemmatimonadaceae bacterium]
NAEGDEDATVLSAYLAHTYLVAEDRATELLVPFDFSDRALIQQSLGATHVLMPQRGPKRELIDLAEQNARHLLEEFKLAALEADERAVDPVYELQRELGLVKVPRSLVCFDISTAQGTDTVGSCVWFENGRPKRAEYRKFKVKTVEGTDDFASMREVVTRYFTRRAEEGKSLPELVVIDGGKGQLGMARAALDALELGDIPTISLAKRDEEIFVVGRSESLRLSRRSPALRLLQRARDEAHRFAVTYNRKRRSMRTVTSELLKIPGIGPSKRRALLQAFGSVQGVRAAGEAEIAKLAGFSEKTAKLVLGALQESSPVREGAASTSPAPTPDT